LHAVGGLQWPCVCNRGAIHETSCRFSGCLAAAFAFAAASAVADDRDRDDLPHIFTATPIKHLVVIFQENVYFGTYPFAQNNAGETPFKASPRTPKSINTLLTPLDTTHNFRPLAGVDLIHNNPNANANMPTLAPNNRKTNGAGAASPRQIDCSQDEPTAPGYHQLNCAEFESYVVLRQRALH
jgi:phospholipase C